MTPRPSVFIGSSSEGLAIAKAIQANLDSVAETTLWSQGVFGLSEGTLESLVARSREFDFALLIESRTRRTPSPRDNVLLELGLFIGVLGQQRTFLVFDRTAGLKLPSDLAGVTAATFQPHRVENWLAAVGPACTRIEASIKKLGTRARTADKSIIPLLVEIYYHRHLLTKATADRMARKLELNGMRCVVREHEKSAVPDALFIGCLVTASEARMVLRLLNHKVRYLFPIDYPEADGGDMAGRKIGLGYWSNYNSHSLSYRFRPVRLSDRHLDQLRAKNLSNAEFQCLLHLLTTDCITSRSTRSRAKTRAPG
jgi:hypothetical protein